MPRKSDPLEQIADALNRIADEFSRYNTAHGPATIEIGEAEVFKASYEREDPEKRELHEYLTGKDSSGGLGRSSGPQDRRGKEKTRPKKR